MMSDPIEQFINDYSPQIQTVTRELRGMIKIDIPEAHESIFHGALAYSLSESVFDRLVYLALDKNYVRLGFIFGKYLPDPGHLLVGEGKRMRHVKVYTAQEAGQPALRQLVEAAWENGALQVAELKKQRGKTRKSAR